MHGLKSRTKSRLEDARRGRRQCVSLSVWDHCTAADGLAVPVGRVLPTALGRLVIDVDNAKALVVALGPLEVVHQRPGEVAPHVSTFGDCLAYGVNVAVEVINTVDVSHAAVFIDDVIPRGTVLRD